MPSPFPGMNPFLEQDDAWRDFHERFLPALAEVLTPLVVPAYIVKLDEHIFLHNVTDDRRSLVGLADAGLSVTGAPLGTRGAGQPIEAPVVTTQVMVFSEEERLSYLEIQDRRSREVVTVVELLSPANKYAGNDRNQYLRKREHLLYSAANLVEIDLLRGGHRVPAAHVPACDYLVSVSRAERRPELGLWPITLRQALPSIPIPLRPPHADVRVDLQALLHRIYDAAGYEYYIYGGTPHPPLSAEDDAWARSLLPSRG